MPLHLHRSRSNRVLWDTFAGRFLDALGHEPGPRFPVHAWLAHRTHRDRLLEAAEARGVRGWVGVPFSFLGDLPELLGVEGRPAGLLTRRRMLTRLATREGRRHGIGAAGGGGRGIARGHALDGLLGELLPEGVAPGDLRTALAAVEDDDFDRRRNAWVADVYAAYLSALGERGLFDPRAVPALLATAVSGGRLTDATAGARTLHLYGLHSLRTRTELMKALAAQGEVDVHTYLPPADGDDEWEGLAARTETLPAPEPDVEIQPVPDQEREMRWVAERVKRRLREGDVSPHQVAVVARVGLEDTRRAHRALEAAGVPASARIRTPLAEVAALRFVLELFRGAADDWPYRILRNALSSPYIDCPLEVWLLDRLANERRIHGLDEWRAALTAFRGKLLRGDEPSAAQAALAERVARSLEALDAFAGDVEALSGRRNEAGWIDLTLGLLDPGILGLRRRLSREVRGRWDAVRLDQRGVIQLEALLREWKTLDLDPEPLGVGEWHALLARLLEGHTLTLSTPTQRGVQVLEAHDAALGPFEHVFLVHANDGEFPRLRGSGGVLTEAERRELRGRLPLSHRELDLRRERTLWRAVTGAAGVSVSYRTTDPSGQPLLPSLLVPEHDQGTELSRVWRMPGTPVSAEERLLGRAARLAGRREGEPVGSGEVPGSKETSAPAGAASGAGGQAPEPEGRLAGAVVSAVAEWEREEQAATGRGVELRPSPWSGHLRDPAVLDRLAETYGPDHVWSAGRLEAYATCPFVFLLERVLGLAAVEQAEEETSALTFGGVAHDVLERFYRRVGETPPAELDTGARELLRDVLQEVRRSREADGEWLGLPVLWRQTFRRIGEAVREYLHWELPLLAEHGHRPVETEYGFGFDEEPVVLVGHGVDGRPATLPLHGRIDRVDREGTGDEAVHHVIDYKSGRPPPAGGYEDGGTLQAALYLSAYARRNGVRCGGSGYRSIKSASGRGSRSAVTWEDEKHRAALAIAFDIPARIRAGHFEPLRAASKSRWAPWEPGIEVVRARGALEEGNRFDAPWRRGGRDGGGGGERA